jgi:hypothetical protein
MISKVAFCPDATYNIDIWVNLKECFMESKKNDFPSFSWRVTSLHMMAYLIAGLLALIFIDYETLFATDSLALLMKPIDSPIVAFGPFLQIILGFAMSIFLYPFRSVFIGQKNGWFYLFILIAGFCIFTPQVPGPGNFEGLLYTNISIQQHLLSLPETILYSIIFSTLLPLWVKYPKKIWNVLSIIAVVLIFIMGVLGYLDATGAI